MRYENLGPVWNPDGSPSDLTLSMLADTGRTPDDLRPTGHYAPGEAFTDTAANDAPETYLSRTFACRSCDLAIHDGTEPLIMLDTFNQNGQRIATSGPYHDPCARSIIEEQERES